EKIPDLSKKELIDQYINSLYTLSESTKEQYKVEIDKFLEYLLANEIKIVDVSTEIFNEYMSIRSKPKRKKKKAIKLKANSQKKIVIILRCFLEFYDF
ncbi:unnamed protein product, partial [marine sediment metagenome]